MVLELGLGVAALLLLFGGSSSGGGGGGGGSDTPTGPGGGGDKPTPAKPTPSKPTGPTKPKPKPVTPTNGPKPKGRGYGGGKWGTGTVPANFDWDGNQLWISPSCDTVAEGARFMPIAGRMSISDENTPTLQAALALRSPPNAPASNKAAMNQVYGFIDYLLDTEGYDQPEDVVARIFSDASPMCAAVDPTQWGPALVEWYQSFSDRAAEYVESEMTGIPFEPSNED